MQKGLFLSEVQTPRQKRRFYSIHPRTVGMTTRVLKVTNGIAKPIVFFYAKITTTQRNNSDFFQGTFGHLFSDTEFSIHSGR